MNAVAERTDTYIDVEDLPPSPRAQSANNGISARLRAIPAGKALAVEVSDGLTTRRLASRLAGLSQIIGTQLFRKYHTRNDQARGCVWVWWTES